MTVSGMLRRKAVACPAALSFPLKARDSEPDLVVAVSDLEIAPAPAAEVQGNEDVLDRKVAAFAQIHAVGGEHRLLVAGDGSAGDVVDEVAPIAAMLGVPLRIGALRLRPGGDVGRQIA